MTLGWSRALCERCACRWEHSAVDSGAFGSINGSNIFLEFFFFWFSDFKFYRFLWMHPFEKPSSQERNFPEGAGQMHSTPKKYQFPKISEFSPPILTRFGPILRQSGPCRGITMGRGARILSWGGSPPLGTLFQEMSV